MRGMAIRNPAATVAGSGRNAMLRAPGSRPNGKGWFSRAARGALSRMHVNNVGRDMYMG